MVDHDSVVKLMTALRRPLGDVKTPSLRQKQIDLSCSCYRFRDATLLLVLLSDGVHCFKMLTLALITAAVSIAVFYVFKRDCRFVPISTTILYRIQRFLSSPSSEHEYKILYDLKTPSKAVKSRSLLHPVYVLRDPSLIKNVLVRDFEYFTDRQHRRNSGELFDLDGEEWRTARRKLLPVFSPEPLEEMFKYFTANLGTLITKISRGLGGAADVGRPVETSVADIMSLAVFGLEITIGKKKDEFTKKALSIIETGFFQSIKASLFGPGPSRSTEKYFNGFLRKKLQSSGSNDFINLMRRTAEKVEGESEIFHPNQFFDEEFPDTPLDGKAVQITEEFLSAQVFQFFTSGLQPIASAVTFALYDLSTTSPDAQTKMRNEITSSITKNGGYNYDAVREMIFLDRCVHESLRLHPVVHSINRICTKDYESEGTKFLRGETVVVPILGLHMDERHFQDPEQFRPERFGGSEPRNPFYMPFGGGPRKCVGAYFTLLAIKVILAKLVQQFTFSLSEQSISKSPHKYHGPFIIPNDIKFNVSYASRPSILS
ncbi:hypothetical protein GE061_016361 [Apolygus lucorum]|uniref:Uncharacterized protein n=1 Tax=Apolygus lucorum TaxID=248454 RepID=A0A6A4K2B7_APOLU|nr:hypothetical protein GE061_016361 [Apolygus lucorum]